MAERFTTEIAFVNGSAAAIPSDSYRQAMDAARNLSYSGERIKRVEIHCPDKSVIAVWDIRWDAVSQQAGLKHHD